MTVQRGLLLCFLGFAAVLPVLAPFIGDGFGFLALVLFFTAVPVLSLAVVGQAFWRTEVCYVAWIQRYVRFHRGRHTRALGDREVERFLSHLAVDGRVAPSTQNQAFAALRFLYRDVLGVPPTLPEPAVRAKHRPHVPIVLTRVEVWRVIDALAGAGAEGPALVATLLYGAGLRLSEALSFRVPDVNARARRVAGARRQGRQGPPHGAPRRGGWRARRPRRACTRAARA